MSFSSQNVVCLAFKQDLNNITSVTKILFPKAGVKHELLLNKLASLTCLLGI